MFPQLVAGPIVRYSEIEKELDNRQESLYLFGGKGGRIIYYRPI